ncbi:MAG: CaiB/BaiF CoA-transferase family protein [SAR324 cluster bacterium]|nr:CaiB/BaiF CoA-transferase family protein [SAR324 cluster bacterium]
MGALDGLLVVSLEQAVAAPFASSRLADAGARVIKIERPEGDFSRNYDHVVNGDSAYFVWLNRGKESIAMDLSQSEEIRLLLSMLKTADVLIENFKPGSLAKLGIEVAELRKENPKLISCSISGYGSHGDWSKMKAYDLLIQAETGMSSITGSADAPGRVGVSVADIAAGMYSWSAILEALIARGISGNGRHIEVSLFDALADWMAVPLLWYDYGGKAPERVGLSHPSICPYGAFKTADGKTLLLSIQNEREWKRFCADILADEAIAELYPDNSIRLKNRDEIDGLVAETLGKMTHADAAAKLKKAEIAYGTLNDLQGFSNHSELRRAKIHNPKTEIQIPAPPAICDKNPLETLGGVPELNQHGEAIRAEFAETVSLKED